MARLAANLLDVAREQFASGADFFAIFDEVVAALEELSETPFAGTSAPLEPFEVLGGVTDPGGTRDTEPAAVVANLEAKIEKLTAVVAAIGEELVGAGAARDRAEAQRQETIDALLALNESTQVPVRATRDLSLMQSSLDRFRRVA